MMGVHHRGRSIPLLSSIPKSHLKQHRQLVLTKGDNNDVDDVLMYPPGQAFVTRDEVVGMVVGYVPYLGWVSIAFQKVFSTWYFLLLVVVVASLAR
jgi:signal peptidase